MPKFSRNKARNIARNSAVSHDQSKSLEEATAKNNARARQFYAQFDNMPPPPQSPVAAILSLSPLRWDVKVVAFLQLTVGLLGCLTQARAEIKSRLRPAPAIAAESFEIAEIGTAPDMSQFRLIENPGLTGIMNVALGILLWIGINYMKRRMLTLWLVFTYCDVCVNVYKSSGHIWNFYEVVKIHPELMASFLTLTAILVTAAGFQGYCFNTVAKFESDWARLEAQAQLMEDQFHFVINVNANAALYDELDGWG